MKRSILGSSVGRDNRVSPAAFVSLAIAGVILATWFDAMAHAMQPGYKLLPVQVLEWMWKQYSSWCNAWPWYALALVGMAIGLELVYLYYRRRYVFSYD